MFADAGGVNSSCTMLLREVLDLHMMEMWIDGFVEREMESFFAKQADMNPAW